MQDLNITTRFALNPDVEYTLIDDEAVLMGVEDDSLFGLNSVGTEILKKLQEQPLSVESISQYLLAIFDVDEIQCMTDIKSFIESLFSANLIVQVE